MNAFRVLIMKQCLITALLLGLFSSLIPGAWGALPIEVDGIPGTVVLSGTNPPDNVLKAWVTLAGKDKAKVVWIGAKEGEPKGLTQRLEAALKEAGAEPLTLLPAEECSQPSANVVAPIKKATGIWLAAPVVSDGLTRLLKEFQGRPGALAASGTATGVVCESYEASAQKTVAGMGLLPGVWLGKGKQPGMVGLGLKDQSVLLVKGRQVLSAGSEPVILTLATGAGRHSREISLKPESIQDLTALRKAAVARTLPTLAIEPVVPEVKRGSLVIIGGGGMTPDIPRRFIELAGGPDSLIVLLPIAHPEGNGGVREKELLESAGAKNVVILPARKRSDVEDPKNLETIRKAGGIWFGGGRQWHYVDAYEGTKAVEAFRSVLDKGGVIGGSSAGATIQGEYLCRGNPLGNLEIMVEGYEKGLAFLPGVAIDQHFTQRNRFADMTSLMSRYPQYLGIGLDESTAIVVQGTTANVMGIGEVHFYDPQAKRNEKEPDHLSLKAGSRYDLKNRMVMTSIASAAQPEKETAKLPRKLFDGKTLDGWKSSNFANSGAIEVKDGAISIGKGKVMSGITYKNGDFPKMDYEVTLEAKKTDGHDFFATTTFPFGDNFCSLVVGGWSGKVVGLSNINSMDASSNDTRKDREFNNDQWYKIRIRVSKERIEAWIDKEKVVDQDTTDLRIGIRIECSASKPFGISTYQTASLIRNIEVRPLSEADRKEIANNPPKVKD